MGVDETLTIHCLLPDEVNDFFPKAALCAAMRKEAGREAQIYEHSSDLRAAPAHGYLVMEQPFDSAEASLSRDQLRRTFLLDGANGPALYRSLEDYDMPGGFQSEEWFKVRNLHSVRYPVLRIEVADPLGYERLHRYETAHFAQYNPGVGLPALLVRYLVAFDRWRDSR